ncbi:hypothetical protein D3C75_797630 [compost metagenome]
MQGFQAQRPALRVCQPGAQGNGASLAIQRRAALWPQHALIAADPRFTAQQLAALQAAFALGQVGQATAIPALAVFQGQAVARPSLAAQLLEQRRQHRIAAQLGRCSLAGIEQWRQLRVGDAGTAAGHPWGAAQVADRPQAGGRHHRLARLAGIEGIGHVQQVEAGVAALLPREGGAGAEQRCQGTDTHPADHFAPVHTACHRTRHPYPCSFRAPDVAALALQFDGRNPTAIPNCSVWHSDKNLMF